MTPDIRAEIRRMYDALEPAFKEVRPQYPDGACVWACTATREMLHWQLNASIFSPILTVQHVEGDFDHSFHAWLEVSDDDETWIVDPTLYQFKLEGDEFEVLSGSCGVIPSDHPLRARYHDDQRAVIWCSEGGHLR